MASYNKFQDFVEQLCKGVHQLHAAGHTCNYYLSNEQPLAADTIKTDIAEITQENGYDGPADAQNDLTESPAGTALFTTQDKIYTGTGDFGPLQFVVLYNDTATSPADALISWWDYGSAVTVHNGETFTIDAQASTFTLT